MRACASSVAEKLLRARPSRAYLRQFGLSRMTFREMALNGLIPGVTKASW